MPQELIKKNHMDVAWHECTDENGENVPVVNASIAEKASIIGRVGIMFLSCGTGAWRVRSSMNTLAEARLTPALRRMFFLNVVVMLWLHLRSPDGDSKKYVSPGFDFFLL